MKLLLMATVLLCAGLAALSEVVRGPYVTHRPINPPPLLNEAEECAKREDKCSIIRAMEATAALERKILKGGTAYRWLYFQQHAKHTSGDPNLCLHTKKCH